ncbi:MAG: hypothetical protein Fur0018_02550 [Anaerolineales bacterium]
MQTQVPEFQFTMRTGPAPGKIFELNQPEISIGRDVSNDFIINDVEISRRHARLYLQGTQYIIEDLGSTNGTFINGQRLSGPHVLRSGDVVLLGENVTLVFGESISDPNATVVSNAAGPAMSAPPMPQTAPEYAPAMEKISSQIATGNLNGKLPQAPAPSRRLGWVWAGCGCLVVVCVVTVAVLWYIDANYLWCTVLPFIPGCP